jgi:YceI-like domain
MTVYQDTAYATTFHAVRRKRYALIGIALLAAACAEPARRPATPPGPTAPWPPVGSQPLHILPRQSEIRLFVYRDGPMAALGHNHVIVNRQLSGVVYRAPRMEESQFELAIPSAQFSVDEPELRREAGEDFAKEVPTDARAGTLRNALGPALLDVAAFPNITVRSVRLSGAPGAWLAELAISVAGHASRVTTPFNETHTADEVAGSGEFTLRQSQLGLKPFSVMLGALTVRDELRVRFKITARRESQMRPTGASVVAAASKSRRVPSGA